MKTGPRNSIADVAGLRVGHASDMRVRTGTTVLVADVPNVASVHVMGGAPGTRDTELLAPENIVQSVDALFLSGGSAFGLEAGSGAMQALAAMGRGFPVGGKRIPIVPGAILFDLIGGEDWDGDAPYAALGEEAVEDADKAFELGSVGAGTGATTGCEGPDFIMRGGIGSASMVLESGVTVAALVAVNAVGSPTLGPHLRAARFEIRDEFGGLGVSPSLEAGTLPTKRHPRPGQNTTIGIVATDAKLTKGQAKRLAIAAHDGFAHALWPAHTPMDGDLMFAMSTGAMAAPNVAGQIELSAAAASVTARAIARGVWAATPLEGGPPTFRERHSLA